MDKNVHIAIIGAGMGGLATALALAKRGFKKITVYETASNLGFVGAGIQLAPNMARVLDRLGVWGEIEKEAVDLKDTSIRQGATNKELGHVDLEYIRSTYEYPHMVGHRSSLANALFNGCKKENAITFHFSTTCTGVSAWSPKPILNLQPRDGPPFNITADILLASDGIKSPIRTQMLKDLNISAQIIDTQQAAYRIMLTRQEMEHDPELLELIDTDRVIRWIGPKRHIIAYPISNKQIYNLSTTQPDFHFSEAPSVTYTTKGSKNEMLDTFSDFCPMIQRMLNLVKEGEVCEWRLRVHSPLPTWVNGNVALVGDACHPTLPHLAQGAAQAIEDAAVLGVVLDLCPDGGQESVQRALRVYQVLRKERAEALVELAAANGRGLHLGEGKAKEERDRAFEKLQKEGGKSSVPDKWADAEVQKMIYGHDCEKIAEEKFKEIFEGLKEKNGVKIES